MEPASTLGNLAFYAGLVFGLCVLILVISAVVGQRTQRSAATNEPYESGIIATGGSRFRLSSKFYLMAMFFVIFDLEAVYIFAWAVSARESGWAGFIEVLIFILILLAALIYLWRVGALDWGPGNRRNRELRAGQAQTHG